MRSARMRRVAYDVSRPTPTKQKPMWNAFRSSLGPETRRRIKSLMEGSFHRPGHAENRLMLQIGQRGD